MRNETENIKTVQIKQRDWGEEEEEEGLRKKKKLMSVSQREFSLEFCSYLFMRWRYPGLFPLFFIFVGIEQSHPLKDWNDNVLSGKVLGEELGHVASFSMNHRRFQLLGLDRRILNYTVLMLLPLTSITYYHPLLLGK